MLCCRASGVSFFWSFWCSFLFFYALFSSICCFVFEFLCTSQIEASTSTPQAFELLKIGLFKFPPLGAKSRSNVPPTTSEIPLLKDKFRLQSNTLTLFRERYAVITPSDFF